jgi:hypothetical protein
MKTLTLTLAALAVASAASTMALADGTTSATGTYKPTTATPSKPVLTDAERYIINQGR